MKFHWLLSLTVALVSLAIGRAGLRARLKRLPLPCRGALRPNGDFSKAVRQATATRERICINGLWRWQPARAEGDDVPAKDWGFFKVPGCWPGITDYMQKDCQTVFAHPSWKNENLASTTVAWYQREIAVPSNWAGRRIAVSAEYVNSYAAVYVDGKKAGEIRFPGGDADITSACRPGTKQMLSLLVVAMPLKETLLSYQDTNSARKLRATVPRRGLCGDVFLVSTPIGARISDFKIDTSVRNGEITFDAAIQNLPADGEYSLHAKVSDHGKAVREFASKPFKASDLKAGRFSFTEAWKPAADKFWDTDTPQNMFDASPSLVRVGGELLDQGDSVRFGYREFWIDGRDFFLNGTRIFLSAVPLDNAEIGAATASYEAARESMERLKSFGVNFVYTHNYDCEPGSHLSFAEILRAADDVGMLVSMTQPHFSHYDWKKPDADQTNGYARHAEFYVRASQNHPAVVAYAMSHNATGYDEDMNPDLIDGIHDPRDQWAQNNIKLALRAEAIVKHLDPGRIVYHHASGNLGVMHDSNFYPNFVPVQELCDWFEHWSTKGVKPMFTCEYGAPFSWDWGLYRGWYRGQREWGSAKAPWEFCLAEWNSQFLGDRAFHVSDGEKANLRWEAKQWRSGGGWFRWDYPQNLDSKAFDTRYEVFATYLTDNWRAFRTWGVSAISAWQHDFFWKLRDGVDRRRKNLAVDWEKLQRPGFSPDYLDQRYERMDLAFDRADWIPTAAAKALYRNNRPYLGYIGGSTNRFTSKDHNFLPGDTIEKQVILINNSRRAVTCDFQWSLNLSNGDVDGRKVNVPAGEQLRVAIAQGIPLDTPPGKYELRARFKFSAPDGAAPIDAETQKDAFAIDVLPHSTVSRLSSKIAVFDPNGDHRGFGAFSRFLRVRGVRPKLIKTTDDLSGFDVLLVARSALTVNGAAPDISRVRDGLRVIVFEQSPEVLEKAARFPSAAIWLAASFSACAGSSAPGRTLQGESARLAWRIDAAAAAAQLRNAAGRRPDDSMVRHARHASLAVRQLGQRRVGVD